MTLNARKEICLPVHNLLRERPRYLTYDPPAEAAQPLRLRRGHPGFLLNATRDHLYPVTWQRPLTWAIFRERDPHSYDAFLREGLQYDQNYVISESAVNINDEFKPKRVFLRRNLGNNRIVYDPLIFMRVDGSSLSQVFNALQASDMVLYLAGSYPIRRAPGKVTVYALTSVEPPDAPNRQFRADPICEYTSP
ncbi:MAG TPA: hypothetical protein VEF76_06685 [Patescibacteria group bacterium]|nr:hypothetical protein [Patescibacteria group bacterium]